MVVSVVSGAKYESCEASEPFWALLEGFLTLFQWFYSLRWPVTDWCVTPYISTSSIHNLYIISTSSASVHNLYIIYTTSVLYQILYCVINYQWVPMLWHCIRAAGAKFLLIPSETTFRKVSKRGQNGQKSSQYTSKMLDPYGKSWQISGSYGKSLAETPPPHHGKGHQKPLEQCIFCP